MCSEDDGDILLSDDGINRAIDLRRVRAPLLQDT